MFLEFRLCSEFCYGYTRWFAYFTASLCKVFPPQKPCPYASPEHYEILPPAKANLDGVVYDEVRCSGGGDRPADLLSKSVTDIGFVQILCQQHELGRIAR